MHWTDWAIAGIILFFLEAIVPGFWIASFGVGCFAAGLTSLLTTSLLLQVFVFLITSVFTLLVIQPLVKRFLYSSRGPLVTGSQALIGQHAVVVEEIDPIKGTGRIRVGSETWKAVELNHAPLATHSQVTILKIDGVTAIIQAIEGDH